MEGLVDLGFSREGKDCVHEELNIYVEVPSSVLEGSEERVKKIEIQDKYSLYIIGIDDILIDRLRALVQWDEKMQEQWIFRLIKNYIEEIDFPYVQEKLTNEENGRFNNFLESVMEESVYARMQFELIIELDKKHVPFSIVKAGQLELISLPSKSGRYYGVSLYPVVMAYTYEEDGNGDETFFALKPENMEIEELLEWIQLLPEDDINKKDELIITLERIMK